MKILMMSLMFIVACSRNGSNGSNELLRQEQVSRSVQVGSPPEAISILNTAVRMNNLYTYQGVRFYLYDGQYLFTSRVINQFNYELRQ